MYHPTDKNGERITMWNLIERKKYPPTRLARYCCEELKEYSSPNAIIVSGVRADESVKRKGRSDFAFLGDRADRKSYFSLKHIDDVVRDDERLRDALDIDENEETAYDCKFITSAKKNKKTMANPIYWWTENDVWNFIRLRNIEVNPLYAEGFLRVGCVGCPLGGRKSQLKEFERWPVYKQNYIRAFDKMIKRREKDGLVTKWSSGEDVFKWWIQEPRDEQLQFSDDDFN